MGLHRILVMNFLVGCNPIRCKTYLLYRFCRKSISRLLFTLLSWNNGKHGQGTHCQWVLTLWQKIPQKPQNLSAQFVCPSPKFLDFNEKSLHRLSVVRDCSVCIGVRLFRVHKHSNGRFNVFLTLILLCFSKFTYACMQLLPIN